MLKRIKDKLLQSSKKGRSKKGLSNESGEITSVEETQAMATKKKAAKKKAAVKSTTSKKAATKKVATKKAVTKKAATKKAAAKKSVTKKAAVKKAVTKKATAKKAVAKKVTTKKAAPAAKAAPASKKPTRKPAKATATPSTSTKVVKPKPMNAALSSQLQQFKDFTPYEQKKKEEYMSEPMKNHFRHILNSWRAQLMQEVDRTVDHMKDEASNFADPNDRATQEEEFALELRTRDRERKLIRKIGKTLDRIDEDDYGWCDQCGVEIAVRRLEARPTADLCIDCKTLDEIREKQTKA